MFFSFCYVLSLIPMLSYFKFKKKRIHTERLNFFFQSLTLNGKKKKKKSSYFLITLPQPMGR